MINYADIPITDPEHAVIEAFTCSELTARDMLGEISNARAQGQQGQPIYAWADNDVAAIALALRLDSRFDSVDREALATLLLEAWSAP